MDLRDFAFSSPFGIGVIGEYYFTGEVSFSPSGYASWAGMSAGLEYSLLGTTKARVYAPVVYDAFYGSTGLFTAFPVLGSVVSTAVVVPGALATTALISKTIVDTTYEHGGKPHLTSFTGQMSGRYFDY